jgi:antitoxin component YwqK of YwqJK toxin-antitoxin module
MHKLFYIKLLILALCLSCCTNRGEKELTEEEKHIQDSIVKAQQKLRSDSAKRTNPLLILPPDSTYTGDYTDKYPNGIVKFKGYFRFGKRHGQWMSFYPNGLPWSEMHYDKGLREGPNMAYFETGKPRYTGFYKNDHQDSIWCYYDSTGKIAEKVLFRNKRFVKSLPLK